MRSRQDLAWPAPPEVIRQLRYINSMQLRLPPLFLAALVSGCAVGPAENVIDRSGWVSHAEVVGPPPYIACHRIEGQALLPTPPRHTEPSRLWTTLPNAPAAQSALRACVSDSLRSNGIPTPGYTGDKKRDEFFQSVGACMKAAGYELELQYMYVQAGQASC
jgi:hypothetical protein